MIGKPTPAKHDIAGCVIEADPDHAAKANTNPPLRIAGHEGQQAFPIARSDSIRRLGLVWQSGDIYAERCEFVADLLCNCLRLGPVNLARAIECPAFR